MESLKKKKNRKVAPLQESGVGINHDVNCKTLSPVSINPKCLLNLQGKGVPSGNCQRQQIFSAECWSACILPFQEESGLSPWLPGILSRWRLVGAVPKPNRIEFCSVSYQCLQSVSQSVSSVSQWCPTLCDPMNRSMPGLPVHHLLPVP